MAIKILARANEQRINDWIVDFALRHVSYTEVITILSATSDEEAREQFRFNTDLNVIVVDACIENKRSTTLELVKEFREIFDFKGIIIGTSTALMFLDQLTQAGCNERSSVDDLPRKALEVLGLRNLR